MLFVWLFLYGVAGLLGHILSPRLPWADEVCLVAYTGVLLGWILATGRRRSLWLTGVRFSDWKAQHFFLPQLLPVLLGFVYFGISVPSPLGALTMLCAVILEELVFRRLLPVFLCRSFPRLGGLLASLMFATAHLLNLETGAEGAYVLCQMLYALAAGLALWGICVSSRSLLPCVGIHFLLNLTATPPRIAGSVPFWLSVAIYLLCGARGGNLLKKREERYSV